MKMKKTTKPKPLVWVYSECVERDLSKKTVVGRNRIKEWNRKLRESESDAYDCNFLISKIVI